MANINLIKGAAVAAPINDGLAQYYLNSQAQKNGGFLPRGIGYPSRKMIDGFLNGKMNTYIDELPPNYKVEKLPAYMRPRATDMFRAQRLEAGNFQRAKAKAPKGSSAWIQADSYFQSVKSKWANLSTQLDNFAALKTEFLEDHDNSTVSNGSDNNELKMLFSSDDHQFNMTKDKIEWFLPDGSVVNGNKLPKYFNKNSDGASKLLNLNQTAYKAGGDWDGPTRDFYRRQVNLIVQEKGREGLLSLATDNFLDNPIIDKDGPNAYLLLPENHDDLHEFVVDSWTSGMQDASRSGKNNKSNSTSTGSNGSGGLIEANVADQYYGENLGKVVNALPLNSGRRVDGPYDDGTYDLYYRSAPNAAEYKVATINPNDPADKSAYYKWLGISASTNSGIDTNLI